MTGSPAHESRSSTELLQEVVYDPDPVVRHPRRLMAEISRDFHTSVELAWRLFLRDLKARYRQSLLGYVWAVLPPLAVTLTFVFINRHGILELEGEAMAFPYPVFVFTGTMLWQVFVDAINAPLKLLTTYRGLLVKINFPREALILAGIEEVLFNLGIRLVLAAAVLLYFRVPPPPSALLVPLGIVGLLGLGLLIGIVLAPVGVLYTDVQYSLTILISMWFFLTPVVYAPRAGETAELLNLINPVTPLLVTSREWLLAGSATDLRSFIVVLAVTLTLLVFGWLFFRIAMPHMVERMGA